MSITKLIKECANRNFAKAQNLFESELKQKVYEILGDETEELLDLNELESDDETELKAEAADSETDEVKTESEGDADEEVKTEADETDSDKEVTESDETDAGVDGEACAESCESDEELEEAEHQEKFKALLDEYGVATIEDLTDEQKSEFFSKLKESEEDMLEMDYDTEDDFEDMAEKLLFGKTR